MHNRINLYTVYRITLIAYKIVKQKYSLDPKIDRITFYRGWQFKFVGKMFEFIGKQKYSLDPKINRIKFYRGW